MATSIVLKIAVIVATTSLSLLSKNLFIRIDKNAKFKINEPNACDMMSFAFVC